MRSRKRRHHIAAGIASLLLGTGATGCIGHPSPLAPGLEGSVGLPHAGVLTGGEALAQRGPGFERYRSDGVRYGTPRLVAALERAASRVAEQRPGSPPLLIADLSEKFGGKTPRHRSHRTGRDADLLLYATTAWGQPVTVPGFVRFGKDGLARATVDGDKTYLRFDVDRNWLLVRALLDDPQANVQWLFIARWLEARLLQHAIARGEDFELVFRAATVLHQPSDSAAHDDHFHVRLGCTDDEMIRGCVGGPQWPWMSAPPSLLDDDDALYAALEQEGPP